MFEVEFAKHLHPVYTAEEAERLRLQVCADWRSAQTGEWVRTDTGYVLEVLTTGQAGRTPWIRTACGTYPSRKRDVLGHEPRDDRYNFCGTAPRHSVTRRVRRFAEVYARTGDELGAFRCSFPRARSDKYIRIKARFLLGLPAVKEIVQVEVTKIFTDLKIDRKYIFTEAKQMYDKLKKIEESDTRENASVALTEVFGMRFRLLKFFSDSLQELQPAQIEGSVTERTTFTLTAEQMAARARGENPPVVPSSQSIEVRKVIKGATPAMPGEVDVREDNESGGNSDCGIS